MPVPPGPHKCANPPCGGWNTVTHYQHIAPGGFVHDFEIPNPPGTVDALPYPQPCPIDGCYTSIPPGTQPPPGTPLGNPVYSYCLDCANIF